MTKYSIPANAESLPPAHNYTEHDLANQVEDAHAALDLHGIVQLNGVLTQDQLHRMQRAFESRLGAMRWNNGDGYERTERFRLMVEDVLTIDQGFVDVALHPLITGVLRRYLGAEFTLNEAKGWRSLPTWRDFHGWHGDQWYDQTVYDYIPREVKAAVYLSDVNTGAFNYLRGTHRRTVPRDLIASELTAEMLASRIEMKGPAGTVVMFDTSGIHRQGCPILEPRNAIFLNYHDPRIKVRYSDSDRSYRYHPLILNAAFLGGLSDEDQRILGFGERSQLRLAYSRPSQFRRMQRLNERLQAANVIWQDFAERCVGKLQRTVQRWKRRT